MINSEGEISADYPFEIQKIDVSDYFIEDNLKFDPVDNPDGIFTSNDNDSTTFSDAEARQELIELNESSEESLISYIDVGNPESDPIIFFLGEGLHFIQEDQPVRVGQEIAEWFEEDVRR